MLVLIYALPQCGDWFAASGYRFTPFEQPIHGDHGTDLLHLLVMALAMVLIITRLSMIVVRDSRYHKKRLRILEVLENA